MEEQMEKPRCSLEHCEEPALLFIAGEWYCGKCVAKWNEALSKQTQMEIQRANG